MWLMRRYGLSADTALKQLRLKRPSVNPNTGFHILVLGNIIERGIAPCTVFRLDYRFVRCRSLLCAARYYGSQYADTKQA